MFYRWKVEELEIEIKETEAEVARWREACELEVEAAKVEMGERDKLVKKSLLSCICNLSQHFHQSEIRFFFLGSPT